ncbi:MULTISPECIES: hypothetical protein [unclassified Frigoribacterium]|uniref:hypothetical protein n=1 Tax=unclassified Frigoribacterium TaxID=2627005 RepID=UPI0006F20000|nr:MULTISPECIES: hypothetical protein [unclassified Frigoribacterium]KQO48134.1 hypothetical protein ASF07_12320 [Frigoribacterium sp. Leaf254]KQT40228.1 hypothetical protein ASG28_12330 [Frigoribacterium sp. Leaf415]
MSTFKNPVGPQPPSVYWRRRAVLALGLIAVVVIIVLIVVRPGSGSAEPGAAATTSAPPADAAPSEPAATETAPAADATADPADTSTEGASDAATCSTRDIELKPVTDKTSYAATELPQISMSITNSGRADCSIDLGSAQQTLVITSGEEQYWSSKDCQVNGTNQVVTLTAGQTLSTPPIAWDRTRSSVDTCESTSREPVTAGGATYRLAVSVGDITSADTAQMILN